MASERTKDEAQKLAADARVASIVGLALACFGATAAALTYEMGLGKQFLLHWLVPLLVGGTLFLTGEMGLGPGELLGLLRKLGARAKKTPAPPRPEPSIAPPKFAPLERPSFMELVHTKGGLALMGLGLVLMFGAATGALLTIGNDDLFPQSVRAVLLLAGFVGPLVGGPMFRLGQNWEHRRWLLEKTETTHTLEAQAKFERFSMSAPRPEDDEREAVRR